MSKRRERTTLDLLRALRSGAIAGKALGREQRRQCVEKLWIEDLSVSEIAVLVDRCEKTVHRDIKEIRRQNALHQSCKLGPEILGEYRVRMEASMVRLSKLIRDPAASIPDKISAINSSMTIWDRFVERLATVGLIGGNQDRSSEVAELAELVRVAGVVLSEFGEQSELAIEIRALITRMRSSVDDG